MQPPLLNVCFSTLSFGASIWEAPIRSGMTSKITLTPRKIFSKKFSEQNVAAMVGINTNIKNLTQCRIRAPKIFMLFGLTGYLSATAMHLQISLSIYNLHIILYYKLIIFHVQVKIYTWSAMCNFSHPISTRTHSNTHTHFLSIRSTQRHLKTTLDLYSYNSIVILLLYHYIHVMTKFWENKVNEQKSKE